jgi:hypothetical protein
VRYPPCPDTPSPGPSRKREGGRDFVVFCDTLPRPLPQAGGEKDFFKPLPLAGGVGEGVPVYDALVLSTARYPGWPTPKAMRSVMRRSWRSLVNALTESAVAS